ncbi:hypothetical protein [Streptomyces caeruleatus]|uniref:Uncharacterized protein n=1 Tax=Streptomyces caeruleatus TaxID=661399 RepID=A0A101TU14_9ACTN|nr:hypothetical protein [Streptomyces caeruleatus]KUN98469.1 hypothetical protein AQJ67_27395 [Streptomyces caeruleatus]
MHGESVRDPVLTAPRALEPLYTEQAATVRDGLDDLRRAAFDRGLAALAQDPFPSVSRASDPAGTTRRVRLTRDVLVEYTISLRRLIVIEVTVLDDSDILVPDT